MILNERQTTTNEARKVDAPDGEDSGALKDSGGAEVFAVNMEDVSFSYGEGEKEAVHRVSLKVKQGEFVAILGHNGSGKSTLARLINGLLSPTEGKITVLGMDAGDKKNLFEIRKNAGIVFQNPDNQTVASIVEDDVAFGPENIGVPREEIGRRIEFALNAVGMQAFRRAETARLSGGQKQRVAIAGVLALMPKIMILDESTAMLDPKGRREVTETVKRLNKENGITVISITHFPEEAAQADRAIVLNRGEVALQGTPDEVLKSEEQLLTFNLTLPRCVKICRDLRQKGLRVPDALNAREIAEEIINNPVKSPQLKSAESAFANKDKDTDKDTESGEQKISDSFAVECADLYFSYDDTSYEGKEAHALNGVNLNILKGDFFGIIGHTGSGKSTFARHLNALEKLPTAQKKYKPKKEKKRKKQAAGAPCVNDTVLKVNGLDLTQKTTDFFSLRALVGMVFQYPEYQLFAETVFEDVAFGLKNFYPELKKDEVIKRVGDAITAVGLDYNEVKDKTPFSLSGGQKRRVAIAGVIVTRPEVLVLDEPVAGLDPEGKRNLMKTLGALKQDFVKTVIIVSHDMDEVLENCNAAAAFSGGKAVKTGAPKDIFKDEKLVESLRLNEPVTAYIENRINDSGVRFLGGADIKEFTQNLITLIKSR